jgi:hypothetical protein
MTDISDSQILQALKEKAKLYGKLASDFEKALNGSVSSHTSSVTVRDRALPLTIELIRDYLQKKGARPGDLAKHFGCTDKDISKLVALPDSGVIVVERGWLKLEDTPANGHKN